MNLLHRILLAGSLLAAAHTSVSAFEGKISLNLIEGKGRSHAINYSMKGQLIRMDIEAEGQVMAMIIDPEKMKTLMLMPEQQMYMEMTIKPPAEATQKAKEQVADIEKTGRTEKILGYTCEEYISKDKGTTTEIWLAEGLGSFQGLGAGGNPMMGGGRPKAGGWEEKFKGKPMFPLRVISRDGKSKETFRMEATKVEPGALPASLFVPPAGYQKFAMPDMGGMNPFK